MQRAFLRSEPVQEVVILGAGFSKALDDVMPTADQLGREAMRRAGVPDLSQATEGWFERWLSRRAEPQPDLSAADNARYNETFLRVVEAIHVLLSERELQVTTPPMWLARLTSAWHFRRSTVVTFNYDTLVERAVESLGLWDFAFGLTTEILPAAAMRWDPYPTERGRVGWHNVIEDLPPLPAPLRTHEPLAPSFHLLKLHGSLNWYWVPGDSSGGTLNSWYLLISDEIARRRFLPGREPFVVPPAATKTAYFMNPIMREIWSTAASAMRQARELHIVGYSLPMTDLLSSSMIAEGIAASKPSINLVNIDSVVPLKRLEAMTSSKVNFTGSVEEWAGRVVEDASRRVVSQFANAIDFPTEDTLVGVGWQPGVWMYATSAVLDDATLVLTIGDPARILTMQRDEIVPLSRIAELSRGASRAVCRYGGAESPLVGLDGFGREVGQSTWVQLLIPADSAVTVGFPSGPA